MFNQDIFKRNESLKITLKVGTGQARGVLSPVDEAVVGVCRSPR